MPKLIKNGQIVEDNWVVMPKPDDLENASVTGENVLVPMSLWLAQADRLSQRNDLGIWIDSDEEVEAIADHLDRFEVIAINFPSFRDGRGYSTARLLRERYQFKGELRAIGDVLQDQLFYMHRCGINAFAVRADRDPQKALEGLLTFTEAYQASVDQPVPLFRRRS